MAFVDVIDVQGGGVLTDRTILVRNGRIQAVRVAGEASGNFSADQLVDGEDRFLVPGLWDSHVHFRTRHYEVPEPADPELIEGNLALLPLYVANGITTVRDAGGDITDEVLAWRKAIRNGTMLGPRILTSGPKLDGPSGGWAGSIRLTSPDQVPAAVDALQALGADFLKIYDGGTMALES